jgi:hypothetical protein
MGESWVGDSGGVMRRLVDMAVADGSGVLHNVQQAYVGDGAGTPQLVWQRGGGTVSCWGNAMSWNAIEWAWAQFPGADFYNAYHDGALVWQGFAPSGSYYLQHGGLGSDTWHTYKVDAFQSGYLIATGSVSIKTNARGLITVEAYCSASASASFNQNGTNRNAAECYCGYYSSIHGNQQSLWSFNNIPGDLRNCYSLDSVQISVYCLHAFLNSGGKFGVVVHHGGQTVNGFGASNPGHTGVFGYYAALKPGWMNNSEWIEVGGNTCPGRTTVREEFRVNGAVGFGLAADSTSNTYYGYAAGNNQANEPRVYFRYRVWEP